LDERNLRLSELALYGLPGDVVATLDPHTEADPSAVLVSFLVAFGAAVGPGPHAETARGRGTVRVPAGSRASTTSLA
jgi:hypothetical protein